MLIQVMNILLLCGRDSHHPEGGGSEVYAERVLQFLAARGHQVTYRTAAYPGAKKKLGQLKFDHAGGKITVYARAAVPLLASRLKLGPYRQVDVIIDVQNGVPFFAGLLSGKPTVMLTHHCHQAQWPVAGPWLSRLGWWLEGTVSPKVNGKLPWVTVSTPSKQELVQNGIPAGQITIIRNGLDTPPALPVTPPATGPVHLVTLSRLVPHKHLEDALELLANLSPAHDVVLDVIGSGWWEPQLKAYAKKLGISHRVVFHGQVTEQRKHELLAGASLHLMPSRKEGWGIAVIEAAWHGVPTVGYLHSGGLADSIRPGETGFLVQDKTQLQQVVAGWLAAPQPQLRRQAQAFARQFSWQETGQQWLELLAAVAAGAKVPPAPQQPATLAS